MPENDLPANILNGTAHATSADIAAIIEARKASQAARIQQAREQASQQMHVQLHPAPAAQPTPQNLTLGKQDAAPSLGVPAQPSAAEPAPAPVTDEDLKAFLEKDFPALKQASIELVQAPFKWQEVLTLGQAVSQAVKDGLPLAKGADAANIVQVITSFLYDTFIYPNMPTAAKAFSFILKPLIIQSIEFAYQTVVKKAGK